MAGNKNCDGAVLPRLVLRLILLDSSAVDLLSATGRSGMVGLRTSLSRELSVLIWVSKVSSRAVAYRSVQRDARIANRPGKLRAGEKKREKQKWKKRRAGELSEDYERHRRHTHELKKRKYGRASFR